MWNSCGLAKSLENYDLQRCAVAAVAAQRWWWWQWQWQRGARAVAAVAQ
eukprot:COSAG01_NODE_436_length_17063_cov_42.157628_16_plen_49_part_00